MPVLTDFSRRCYIFLLMFKILIVCQTPDSNMEGGIKVSERQVRFVHF